MDRSASVLDVKQMSIDSANEKISKANETHQLSANGIVLPFLDMENTTAIAVCPNGSLKRIIDGRLGL